MEVHLFIIINDLYKKHNRLHKNIYAKYSSMAATDLSKRQPEFASNRAGGNEFELVGFILSFLWYFPFHIHIDN